MVESLEVLRISNSKYGGKRILSGYGQIIDRVM